MLKVDEIISFFTLQKLSVIDDLVMEIGNSK